MGWLVSLDGMHQVHPVAVPGQPVGGRGQRTRIPVETDQGQRGMRGEQRVRVAAQPGG